MLLPSRDRVRGGGLLRDYSEIHGRRVVVENTVEPNKHSLKYAIREENGWSYRQLPWNAEPLTSLRTWRSEHGLLYPNTTGHQRIPSCTTFPSLHVAGLEA